MRIEVDDVSRPEVLALLEEHLRNMHELTPPDQVVVQVVKAAEAPEPTEEGVPGPAEPELVGRKPAAEEGEED